MFARQFIDSLDFARNGKELQGAVPVAQMQRLQEWLAEPIGEIRYTLRGLTNEAGKPMLEIELEGMCRLRCQRCLAGFDYPVESAARLLLVPANEFNAFADDGDETVDSIEASAHLDVAGLVEDEILLGLPFAPMHPAGTCEPAVKALEPAKANPFAVLAGLKNK